MNKKRRVWIGILACVIALLGCACFYYFEKTEDSGKAVKKEQVKEKRKEITKKQEAKMTEAALKEEITSKKWSKEKAEEMVPLPDEEELLPKEEGGIADDEGVYEPDTLKIHERVELKQQLTKEEYKIYELTLMAWLEDQKEYRKSVYVTGIELEGDIVTVYLTFQHEDISKPYRHIKSKFHKDIQAVEFAYQE
ncbi:hypothetical protein FYJ34_06760 [Clostridiaceae bacterium 68-1-5]|uniref:Lipoprotein n=1 Tax=Suipraeoptans intestinalis TaxID=2606628 RepID=A0A6N7USJ3_9FIRM|nr:hypothetical protein [Suipraeoptans intestinalis]MSR93961.1 hypothetical protein [Suipraeoptans intestinalis]